MWCNDLISCLLLQSYYYRPHMENPHAERQAVLLERIVKNVVRLLHISCVILSRRCSVVLSLNAPKWYSSSIIAWRKFWERIMELKLPLISPQSTGKMYSITWKLLSLHLTNLKVVVSEKCMLSLHRKSDTQLWNQQIHYPVFLDAMHWLYIRNLWSSALLFASETLYR